MKQNIQCRICESRELIKFLDLGNQPLANSFLRTEKEFKTEERYPLQVCFCNQCHLVQLSVVVSKEKLFSDYIYFSSGMPKLSNHFKAYAEEVTDRFLEPNDFVVEIASNDGILLKFFKDKGYRTLGIDPAVNVVRIAEQFGVRTLENFFSEKLAKQIAKDEGKAKLILANNVVAHIDDHQDLMKGVRTLLAPDGVFVIEAPYLVDMFENLTYDTIYHEHLSYLALRPLKRLFENFDMEAFDMEINIVQGKSLRIFVGHRGKHKITTNINKYTELELSMKMDSLKVYKQLANKIAKQKKQLRKLLNDLRRQGKKIASYGAPAKGNTMLNYCNIGTDVLDYALEDLQVKQNMFTPGMHIPTVSADYAHSHEPDYYLMLAWNYEKQILEKEQDFLKKGGKFIIPVEGIKII